MHTRRIGDVEVSAIGLGGMPMSIEGRPDRDRSIATIHAALDAGVTLIDTADSYHLLAGEVGHNERLVDPRVRELYAYDPALVQTLRAYLDSFGDVAAAAAQLHVHPNTVRYRARRIETLLSTSLADPDVRLLLSLGLRATERIS